MQGQEGKALSRPLLAAACQREWGLSPLPPIAKNRWGKPSFSPSEYANRQFNLSHSGDIAVCCLGERPVGVDFQLPRYSHPAFLDKLCSPQERDWLENFGDSQQAFALLWAMKESFVKYTGRGITRPISGILTPLPDELPSETEWHCIPMGDVIFSVRAFQGGMLSVCGSEAVLGEIVLVLCEGMV